VPLAHTGAVYGQAVKHEPQLALSVFVLVQNGASDEPSGAS
jgi:hypothetical protein